MKPLPLTAWQTHVRDWKDCTRCHLSEGRNTVVLARGRVPCDVVFVGEAPGESEDSLGKPFIGPAGRLLDEIIAKSLGDRFTYALTNLVGCIPRDVEGGKDSKPDDEAIEACKPRLLEFLSIAKPRLVVAVGKLSEDWTSGKYKRSIPLPSGCKWVTIVHPAWILRTNTANRGLAVQKCIIALQDATEELSE